MRRAYLIVLACCILFAACNNTPPPPKNPPVAVNLYTVKAQTVTYFDKYPANTVALNQVDLRPEVQGYITDIAFTEGSHVKKGDKLYEIDQRLFQDAYNQAVANLEVAKQNLIQNQQDADRYTYLSTQDAVAKQTLDHAVVALEQAKASVKASEETVKTAETNLTYSIISAPFDGTIGISQVRLGNMVSIGQTVLNTISTDDPMGVDFLVSEKQLAHFEKLKNVPEKTDKKVAISPDSSHAGILDSLFTIILPDNSIYPEMGKISVIDRAVDPQTGTIRVRVVFKNPDYSLKPGMSCVLRVHNQDTKPELVIPNKAVVELMGEYFVFVVKDTVAPEPNDSTKTHPVTIAVQKKVKLGQTIAPNVIIESGLKEGTKIVVDGVQSLHTGTQISVGQKPQGASAKKDSSKH